MSFTIEIKRTTSATRPRREWRKVRDIKDSCKTSKDDYDRAAPPESHPKEYEYVDDEWVQEQTATVFTQTVDDLDLVSVIAAINGMTR